MISRPSLKQGHVGSKTRSPGQITEKPYCPFVVTVQATFFNGQSLKLVKSFILMNSRLSLNLGHVGSKTRSLDQIKGKPCGPSIGHISQWIFMKIVEKLHLDDFQTEFETRSCGVKNQVTRSNYRKTILPLCGHSTGHIFQWIFMKIGEKLYLDECQTEFESGSCGVKNQVTIAN